MEDNYYSQLLLQISELIAKENYQQAKQIIDEELSMPYVPGDILSKLNAYLDEIKPYITTSKVKAFMSEEEIFEALHYSDDRAAKAVDTLYMSNIRQYIDVIKDVLIDKEISHLVKNLIVEAMVMQNVNEDFIYYKDGNLLKINPIQLPLALKQSLVEPILDIIYSHTYKNPSFFKMCQDTLVNAIYDRYPETIEDGLDKIFAYSVIKYVYYAYQQQDQWNEFVMNNDIDENTLIDFIF